MSASVVAVLYLVSLPQRPAHAQPSADQVLTDMGVSAADKQRVLNGEFVTTEGKAVSERDLSASLAFLVKASPDSLAKQVVAGDLIRMDPQVQAYGQFNGAGSLADLAGLQIAAAAAQKLSNAEAGEKLNLGTSEIATLNASGGTQQATQEQLRQMLLARFQAYLTSGLAGIVPYDRGGGKTTDVGAELRKASDAAVGLKKYLPTFQQVLVGYPKATSPGMQQTFHWLKYNIDGVETYVLTHTLAAADAAARAIVQRQFYVSTGYNAEQAVVGFLPVAEGTVVAYRNHVFTDQVAGFGSSTKRSIGTRMMAGKLKGLFETARKQVAP
jgi:hypothetical protein